MRGFRGKPIAPIENEIVPIEPPPDPLWFLE
jgi:hypothetical protein